VRSGRPGWRSRCGAAALLALVATGTSTAAELAPAVQQRLANATFEVVELKPEPDPLSYEKPLPLELIPFRERTDKYRSVGTAFAIGKNRFVTAGHVLVTGAGSQFGAPALRDASGNVFPIETVIKYSSGEDYAVFSVRGAPAVVPLATRRRPPLNEPVFAVGNAFGEGVVIRDGLYTSDTPEELDGRWKWLRFSAAASPGNSGGPLVDRNGRVLGVVLRKSANENLNFAVAIEQVVNGSEAWAHFEGRSSYRFAVMRAADTSETKEQVALPKSVPDFYGAVLATLSGALAKQHAAFVNRHAEQMFPHGSGSLELLHSLHVEHFPRLVTEGDSGTWGLPETQVHTVQLNANGLLEIGAGKSDVLARLRAPDDVAVASLFEDSKLFMDLLLKGAPVQRAVGSDSVRVTSMGKAQLEYWYTDSYGRLWQMRTWAVPFNDTVLVTLALPTPDGCALFVASSPSQLQDPIREELKQLADFVYVSFSGKLQQWRDYLAHPALQPKAVRALDLQFDYGKSLALRTSRFKMQVSTGVQKIDADSRLMLKFTFLPDGSGAVWDVGGVYLADGEQAGHWIDLLRRPRPPPSLPEEFANRWRVMTTGGHPFNATAYTVSGSSHIEVLVNAQDVNAGRSNVGYTLTVTAAGEQSQRTMKNALELLERGLTITEQ
jgi:hypothetical protein